MFRPERLAEGVEVAGEVRPFWHFGERDGGWWWWWCRVAGLEIRPPLEGEAEEASDGCAGHGEWCVGLVGAWGCHYVVAAVRHHRAAEELIRESHEAARS